MINYNINNQMAKTKIVSLKRPKSLNTSYSHLGGKLQVLK